VPVAITGGREAQTRGSWIIRPVTLRIRVGHPIETAAVSLDERDDLVRRVRQEIEKLLREP
jgi:1-acyl-sn-glycerol-3-phosphate acyltransferase